MSNKSAIDWQDLHHQILSRLDIRAEAEALGVEFSESAPDADGWTDCKALDRKDNSPSACINTHSLNGVRGRFKDRGGQFESLSFFDLAAKLKPFPTWQEARAHYAAKVGVALPGNDAPRPKSFDEQLKDVDGGDAGILHWLMRRKFAASRSPVTPAAVADAGPRYCTWKGHEVLAFAATQDFERPCGYLLYRADGEKFPAAGTLSERKTHNLRGSTDGWFVIGGIERLRAAAVVVACEGIPDALAVHPHLPADHVAISNTCGASGRRKLPVEFLRGKRVIAIGDTDDPGRKGAVDFADVAASVAAEVRVPQLPYPHTPDHGKDLRDYLADGHGWQNLQALIDAAPIVTPKPADSRLEVIVTDRLDAVGDAAVEALSRDATLYTRAKSLVHVVVEKGKHHGVEFRDPTPQIRPISVHCMAERISAVARFIANGDEPRTVNVPGWCARAVFHRETWPGLRHLSGVVSAPVLRADGSILSEPGWDSTTGLFYFDGGRGEQVDVPDRPTIDDARRGVAELLDVVCDYPFELPAHRSAWLALVLTVIGRAAFSGPSPLFLSDANVRGCGKSMLIELASIIATGRSMPRMAFSPCDEEMRKLITSVAMSGDAIILLDNIGADVALGGAALDAALTSTVWKDRLLATNRTIEESLMTTWCASGNNVQLKRGGDIVRRICWMRIKSPEENPETRTGFKHPNLIAHVHANRIRLLIVALTILRSFILAGRPRQNLPAWGSFDGWSELIRDAIVWTGEVDPGSSRKKLAEESDKGLSALAAILEFWPEIDPGNNGLTTGEIVRKLDQYEVSYPNFRAAAEELCGKKPTAGILGSRMGHLKDRLVGTKMLHYESDRRRWSVESCAPLAPLRTFSDSLAHEADYEEGSI